MNQLQVEKETCQEHKLIEIIIQETDLAFVSTLKGKLKLPLKEKMKHEEDYLMLKTRLYSEMGTEKIRIRLE